MEMDRKAKAVACLKAIQSKYDDIDTAPEYYALDYGIRAIELKTKYRADAKRYKHKYLNLKIEYERLKASLNSDESK